MFYGSKFSESGPDNTIIEPIEFISLFTLSAAVMGFIFGYQPAQLYFDGKKKLAVNLFLQTIAYFAVITSLILTLFFSGVLIKRK
ncbi:hypothetical protein A2954_01775 [Candidatus Roizmanbacteria bacterium RIFCSPLOWO2_01_FULL_37_12]|uniref:Uncharacterized protein n=1 Tax=Candidatus Roizmanbacteria bacterium RIFCSPLOWO2_01_FULL_37_12 TaxID=1802056 RepID=A0A1F7I9D0_9BACT|nr:MAG: hypothetical protein A2768_01075 [Candidatus Roizmanbacteria bacterium RIFCSPHIGHO2_01_FULL_37_16]OGK24503.1 MAG: hypothetical protein A3D76_05750 [Candidatus Roizmanbacteria bacterium RIFCSPHIGHO2_02_FULL_37_9b]OGK39977.1 MAG: hypothetical protein A2954_01775 [Candidatus Roizmanbacteria bacterium RIFCSPLOWO2_01_FULL_37_12]